MTAPDPGLIGCPDAERAILGCALLAPHNAATALGDLEPDDYTDTRCQVVHTAIRQLLDTDTPPDPITVLAHLRTTGAATSIARSREPGTWLHDLAESAPVPASAEHYRRAILEHTYRRALASAAVRWAQVSQSASVADCDQALDEAHAAAMTARRRAHPPAPARTAAPRRIGGAA